MRIHIKTTATDEIISYNYLHLMTGALHKWIGNNSIHDTLSLYSFSHLRGGKGQKEGLSFKNGANFFISAWNIEIIKKIVSKIQKDSYMFSGLNVIELVIEENPDLSNQSYFFVASPVFIQRTLVNGRKKFYFYDDKESSQLLEETLHRKMENAGLSYDDSLKISFDLDYSKKKTSKVDYKKGDNIIHNKASWCPVIIEGKTETKAFAWNVGIGNSTGIGFGALK